MQISFIQMKQRPSSSMQKQQQRRKKKTNETDGVFVHIFGFVALSSLGFVHLQYKYELD